MIKAELRRFLGESLAIEGIHREPSTEELTATREFLLLDNLSLGAVCKLQSVYAPGRPIRSRIGMNVRVGKYIAPLGGRGIPAELSKLCLRVNDRTPSSNPYREHVRFEQLHPFLDGNGRTGRTIWAWHMQYNGFDPFGLSFLHRWYYQSLDNS